MAETTTAALKVRGATIYYEIRGTGPVLLLIPGGNGDAGPYAPVAQLLSDRYTVITYDRRGFFRSPYDDDTAVAGPASERIADDVADAVALLKAARKRHGRPKAPAYVFGSSSGAVVALHLLTSHPDRVTKLVAHEPPLIGLLPDGPEWRAFFDDVVARYRAEGQDAATAMFGARVGHGDGALPDIATLPPHVAAMVERMRANQRFWFEHELRQYPAATPDLSALAGYKDKLVLAGGDASRGFMPYQPNVVLAERLGLTVTDFAGDHIGYAIVPAQFAPQLDAVLTG